MKSEGLAGLTTVSVDWEEPAVTPNTKVAASP